MIAWWPEHVAPGAVSDHPSAFWDFLPTACELAGIDPPKGIDGLSFLPELLGREQAKHEYLYWQYRGKEAVRKGPWKAVRLRPDKPMELYNLETDLGEELDVADKHPDVVAEMEGIVQDENS
jgi:arylsulfatase A-like enzyme